MFVTFCSTRWYVFTSFCPVMKSLSEKKDWEKTTVYLIYVKHNSC